MKLLPPIVLPTILWAILCLFGLPVHSFAQEADPSDADQASPGDGDTAPSPGTDAKIVNEILNRLGRLEQTVDRFRRQRALLPTDESKRRIIPSLESMQLGNSFQGQDGARYFVARLMLVNLTDKPARFKREDITLSADGDILKLTSVPPIYKNYSLQVGNQSVPLRDLEPAKSIEIPVGGTASSWLFFGDVPKGGDIPSLTLRLKLGEQTEEVDVNEFAAQSLGLEVERIGPQQSLALVTISGTINTINLGTLAETLEDLAAQKVARCVIRFTDASGPLDERIRSWLYQSATGLSPQSQNDQFPVLPATIRELHLCQMPKAGTTRRSPPNVPTASQRIHETDADAVDAALASAYEVLPRDELLREIRFGHPLARAAALSHGGGRLESDQLPLILSYADDDDPLIQRAALTALRHFGEPVAVAALVEHARKNAEPTSEKAIESLAASRYASAHEALLKLLENEDPKSKIGIVRILARYPRPAWSETIYRFCQDPRFGLNVEALRALVQVGHPKLVELLEEALQSNDKTLSDEAFSQLAARAEGRSETIAMNYTLSRLENEAPTPQMRSLLMRVKDPRAIPLLLKQLDGSKNRMDSINLLAAIGDHTVSESLAEKYESFRLPEKAALLTALLTLNSPQFRELATKALFSNEASLVASACQGLQKQGDPEAVQLLAEALESSENSAAWSHICNTLGTLGTPDSQAALRKARDSDEQNKSRYALSALESLRQRSPAMPYVFQARSFEQQEQWKEALEHYGIAIKVDPDLPEAFSGRGNVHLHESDYKKAGADFSKALELDPFSSIAVTGLAIVNVLDGKRDEAIAQVEQARSKVGNDALFAYNSACVYARAFEMIQKEDHAENRDQKMQEYRDKALSELKRSVQGGFGDYDWMRKDPDLQSLRQLPEFKKIHSPSDEDADEAEQNKGAKSARTEGLPSGGDQTEPAE